MDGKEKGADSKGKRDKDVYEGYWARFIQPEISDLVGQRGVSCSLRKAKKAIWKAYKAFNKHCSKNYVEDEKKPLDRHKVAACYMCAILAAFPLDIGPSVRVGSNEYLSNERLAMTVGCSVLASFDVGIARKLLEEGSWDEGRYEKACSMILGGVNFPALVGHGAYVDNMLKCLSFMVAEEGYNLPLLAILLFHWEEAIFFDPNSNYESDPVSIYSKILKYRGSENGPAPAGESAPEGQPGR